MSLLLADTFQQITMLDGQMTGQILQRNLLTALLQTPLAGHGHPSTFSLVLKTGLGTSTEKHCKATKRTELAVDGLFLPEYVGGLLSETYVLSNIKEVITKINI